jgi:hypothetical protein
MDWDAIGKWTFVVGLALAIVAGLLINVPWAIWVLAILGVVVGLLNVGRTETGRFLIAAIAFSVAATALGSIPYVGGLIAAILANIGAFVSGAMVVVALKELFKSAKT